MTCFLSDFAVGGILQRVFSLALCFTSLSFEIYLVFVLESHVLNMRTPRTALSVRSCNPITRAVLNVRFMYPLVRSHVHGGFPLLALLSCSLGSSSEHGREGTVITEHGGNKSGEEGEVLGVEVEYTTLYCTVELNAILSLSPTRLRQSSRVMHPTNRKRRMRL